MAHTARGVPHEVDGRAVWATYHPSAAIRFGPKGAPRAGLLADVRGRAHDVDGRSVWATYHPSAAIRFGPNGAPRAGLLADLTAVARSLA